MAVALRRSCNRAWRTAASGVAGRDDIRIRSHRSDDSAPFGIAAGVLVYGAVPCGVGGLSNHRVRDLCLPVGLPADLCSLDRTTTSRVHFGIAAQRMDRRARCAHLRRIRGTVPELRGEHRLFAAGARLEIEEFRDDLTIAGAGSDRPD